VPAILTLQRTGLTPSRKYMNSFAQSKSPMFVCVTEITLETQRRGSVDYTVPTLRRGVDIDPQFYQDFANQFRRIRATLQTPRVADDEGEPVAAPQSNTYTPTPAAPTPQPAPQPAAPAQDAAPAAQTAPSVPDPAPVPEPNAEPAEDAPIVPDAVTPAPSAAPAASGEPGDGDLPF
jgi:hypothetical protein